MGRRLGPLDRLVTGQATATVAAPLARRAWMDLLGDLTGARVLVVPPAPDFAPGPEGARWDVVILDGVLGPGGSGRRTRDEARLRQIAGRFEPGGRLVVVADNPLSPLRALDRVTGRPTGPAAPRLSQIERAVDDAGLEVVRRFGLLRSSVAALTDFDLDAPKAARAVLEAASVTTDGGRALALGVLRRAAERGRAAALIPAWMVVAARPGDRASVSHPTGRLGHTDSTEVKLVWGEPPVALEKRYSTRNDADREAMALAVLDAAGVAGVPRLLNRDPAGRSRLTWLPGRPLVPHRLGGRSVARWTARAARAIAAVHRRTVRPDGTALLHGDFWLGNLLVDGDRVVGIVDWTGARWGDPADDLGHLVATSSSLVPADHAADIARAAALCREPR